MDDKLDFYLEQCIHHIIKLKDNDNISTEEKELIVKEISKQLMNNAIYQNEIDNLDYISSLVSIQYNDSKIFNYISSNNSKIKYDDILNICDKQNDLIYTFNTMRWSLPSLHNQNIIKVKNSIIKKHTDDILISTFDIAYSKLTDSLNLLDNHLTTENCKDALTDLANYETCLNECKNNYITLNPQTIYDIKYQRNKIQNLMDFSKGVDEKVRAIEKQYLKLVKIDKMAPISINECNIVLDNCKELSDNIDSLRKDKISISSDIIQLNNDITNRYKLYLIMFELDQLISANQDPQSEKEYNSILLTIESQIRNFKICKSNGWMNPSLNNTKLIEISNKIESNRKMKLLAKKIKFYIFSGIITIALIATVIVYIGYLSIKDKIHIPFTSENAIGAYYEDYYQELIDAGFTNVVCQSTIYSLQESETIVSITAGNDKTFKKDDYYDKDDKIVIQYTSTGREDISDIVENWGSSSYAYINTKLTNRNFTNVQLKEIETTKKELYSKISSVTINGEKYQTGKCYVNKSSKIVISYYSKLNISFKKTPDEIIGKDYLTIYNELTNMGFNNITVKRSDDVSWFSKKSKNKSIKSITVNGSSTFTTEDKFGFDDPIIITVHTKEGEKYEHINN